MAKKLRKGTSILVNKSTGEEIVINTVDKDEIMASGLYKGKGGPKPKTDDAE